MRKISGRYRARETIAHAQTIAESAINKKVLPLYAKIAQTVKCAFRLQRIVSPFLVKYENRDPKRWESQHGESARGEGMTLSR